MKESGESGIDTVIKLAGISKKYNLYNKKQDRLKEALHPRRKKYHREFYALKDINLEVKRGEILGIVGKNGSGKSTLLKIISGILTPTAGSVEVKGNIVPLLELGAGFNPELTGMENIYFYCSLLGYAREQTDEIIKDIMHFAELGDFIYQPIKTYSSGMRARLAFAVSVNVDPDILILDEVLAVGDELFKRKCYARMEEFFKGGKTILFVSHDANAINQLCSRAILLDKGECILESPAKMVTMYYQKMLYAVKDKGEDVRREILELNKNESFKKELYQETEKIKADSEKQISKINNNSSEGESSDRPKNRSTDNITKQKAYYIPGLKPKSTVDYRNYDVDIYDHFIIDNNGEKVNALVTGSSYEFRYRVKFNINCKDVLFGMGFKNEKASVISGVTAPDKTKPIIFVNNGSTYQVVIKFKCNLQEGIYYVDLGVSGTINGKRVFLNRVVDASVFKVIYSMHNYWGFVILEQNVNINLVT